ncbi:PHB depolymerase family esterase [Nevskia sp.]|uniref:alpha/beta hydrolase family esterase n=1 Tax=Nevskia sp. TaxID=1929292 RepID=UPI0025E424E4|nr:PHB depolymerase family esterase [Nevskia sp.]
MAIQAGLHRGWLALCGLALFAQAGTAAARDIGSYENVLPFQEQLLVDGRTRDVLYLSPTDAPPGSELAPAVILLEYLQGSPVDMADLTEVAALARDHGVHVILPSSLNGRWNYGGSSFAVTVDDVGFLNQVIDSAIARLPIDPKRIYMAGYSNGGQMTQRFICERASRIAAGAIIAGSIHNDDRLACAPGLPTPMVIFHGTADEQIRYNGNLLFSSSLQTAQHWANAAGCTLGPTRVADLDPNDDGTVVHLQRHDGCADGARVDHYIIDNGGHTWPGALSVSVALGLTTQDVDATRAMWQFFRAYARR